MDILILLLVIGFLLSYVGIFLSVVVDLILTHNKKKLPGEP